MSRIPQSICSLITFSHTGKRAWLSLSGCTDVHKNNQINSIPMSVILQNLLTFGLETFFLSLLDKQWLILLCPYGWYQISWQPSTVLTLAPEEKHLPTPNIPFLRHEQARRVTRGGSHGIVRACGHPGGLAGKTCFQIPATDNYVSNKNKPSLPGMLELKSFVKVHRSISVWWRHAALLLLLAAWAVGDEIPSL